MKVAGTCFVAQKQGKKYTKIYLFLSFFYFPTPPHAGGWHVLRDFSVHSWDYRLALQRLHAAHGVSPFFKVSVVPDPRDSVKSIIQVSEQNITPGKWFE